VPRELPHDRTVPFADVGGGHVPHFVSRAIYAARKVGCETPALDRRAVHFQLTQRAEFFERSRPRDHAQAPIVNTRDEPHADRSASAAYT